MSDPHRTEGTGPSERYFDRCFATQRLMAILRGLPPAETVALCEGAWAAGIEVVEVPIQDADAVRSLEAAVAAGRERGLDVGAGTVIDEAQVEVARAAGAAFTVAPGVDTDVMQACRSAQLPHLPGVATASDISRARRHGTTWLKAFPASVLGAEWISAQRAPFPNAKFVATGGMDADNAALFLDRGARVIAVGSALADPHQLDRLRAIGIATIPDS